MVDVNGKSCRFEANEADKNNSAIMVMLPVLHLVIGNGQLEEFFDCVAVVKSSFAVLSL